MGWRVFPRLLWGGLVFCISDAVSQALLMLPETQNAYKTACNNSHLHSFLERRPSQSVKLRNIVVFPPVSSNCSSATVQKVILCNTELREMNR